MLSGEIQQRRPLAPPQESFVPQTFPDPESNPVRGFAASPAIPESETTFGARFKSRRPPQFDARNDEPVERKQVRFPPTDEEPVRQRQRPAQQPSNFDHFGAVLGNEETASPLNRQRPQVTQIRVNPQPEDEALDVDAFRRVANQFTRQRGSQQQ